MNAQEVIDGVDGLYTYWKAECSACKKVICITNHKKKEGDVAHAGDITPTKYFKGIMKDGEKVQCLCGGDVKINGYSLRGEPCIGKQITEKEYKKIKKELC